ncbi:hypothetical protein PABG_11582 [Paracoccidioides brasiliensis Pb03]|nr:hypothetical protein PABG_11582 [Paracoccidioides brasiliensis Pb03]
MESGSNTDTSFCGHSYYYSRRSQPIYHVLSSSILVISMQLASEMDFESPCKISATSSASHVQVSTVAPKGGALEASDTRAAHLPSCIHACMSCVAEQNAESPLETNVSSFSTLESEVNNPTAQRGASPLSTVKYTLNTGQRA